MMNVLIQNHISIKKSVLTFTKGIHVGHSWRINTGLGLYFTPTVHVG